MAAVLLLAALRAQSSNPALAQLADGIAAYDRKDYPAAIGALKGLDARLPKLADYVGYYLAASEVESNTQLDVAADVAPVWSAPVASPLVSKTALVAANGLIAAARPADAVRVLLRHYDALAQPDGDMALAFAYEAAADLSHAASSYQQIYYRYPTTDEAEKAGAALSGLREKLGVTYPPVSYETSLERADKFMKARNYTRARAEYQELVLLLNGAEQDLARVRLGAADYLRGQSTACQYLRALEVPEAESDAERLYYLAECAGRANNETERVEAIRHLEQQYPRSPWRFKALTSLAGRYLLTNRVDDYEPLYAAAGKSFPAEPRASAAHWRYVWAGYIRRLPDAGDRLREHLRLFPSQSTTTAALYFLGRLAEDAKDYGAARAFFRKLADQFPNYYYGLLGSKRLAGANLAGAPLSARTSEFLRTIAFAAKRPAVKMEPSPETRLRIERAQLLRAAGLADLAGGELRFGAKNSNQPMLLAIEMARSADSAFLGLRAMKSFVPDGLSVPLDASFRDYWQLLFPLPYKEDLLLNARTHSLDPSLVAALIRQESEFNPEAVSSAKAYGLTQVLPTTGRTLARQAGVRPFSSRMLFQPATNLRLGTLYLRTLLDELGGSWEETLAAYNAGKTRATNWRTWAEWREPAEFVESIPFTETHDYVQAVMRNAELYRKIYGERIEAR